MTAGDTEHKAAPAFVFRLVPRRSTFALDMSDEERRSWDATRRTGSR